MPGRKPAKQKKPRLQPQAAPSQLVIPPVQSNIDPLELQERAADAKEPGQIAKPRELAVWLRIWLPIVISGLVLFVVIVQSYISKKQWDAMRISLDETRRTRWLENRAYIGIKAVQLNEPLHVGEYQTVTVTFTNAGKTPATTRNVQHGWAISFDEPTNYTPIPRPVQQATTAPGADFAMRFYITSLDEQRIASINQFREFIYVYGVIEYDDVFGCPHKISFCFKHNPNSQDFSHCTKGNTTDHQACAESSH